MNPEKSPEFKTTPELEAQLIRLNSICTSFLNCLWVCATNYSRDGGTSSSLNFFNRAVDDIIQSIVGIRYLASQGIRNQCRRECRYLLELSIKSAIISQKQSRKTYEEQIAEYKKLLSTTNISIVTSFSFFFIPSHKKEFIADLKKMYGHLCNYIHASAHQFLERIELAKQGKFIGYESDLELKELNDELEQVFSYSIVLLFESMPSWIAGDYLVEIDGKTNPFYFNQSKYVTLVDRFFDYKHERQSILAELEAERLRRIKF